MLHGGRNVIPEDLRRVLFAVSLALSGCGTTPSSQEETSNNTGCGTAEGETAHFYHTISCLQNGSVTIGEQSYVLPMSIVDYRDKIGLWCAGPVHRCFTLEDRDGSLLEICETRDTRTTEPWVLHSPQFEKPTEETLKLLLSVLQNAIANGPSPDEIRRVDNGWICVCILECDAGIDQECARTTRYADALHFIDRWVH